MHSMPYACTYPGETARADLFRGGGQWVGPPPPLFQSGPPFFEEIIPMKLNFIIRLS